MRNHKIQRLYYPSKISPNTSLILEKPQSHYLVNVLRLKNSYQVIVFNKSDGEFLAEITDAHKTSAVLKIIKQTRPAQILSTVHLFYSPVKSEKNEFIVQKATELGATDITPIICERTVKRAADERKLALVSIEASEQCERIDIPQISEIRKFSDILTQLEKYNIIFCDETGQGVPFASAPTSKNIDSNKPFAIIVGPEGGFSPVEIKQIYALKNAVGVGLGPRILRAETAIIAALALYQSYFGDFSKLPDFQG